MHNSFTWYVGLGQIYECEAGLKFIQEKISNVGVSKFDRLLELKIYVMNRVRVDPVIGNFSP